MDLTRTFLVSKNLSAILYQCCIFQVAAVLKHISYFIFFNLKEFIPFAFVILAFSRGESLKQRTKLQPNLAKLWK